MKKLMYGSEQVNGVKIQYYRTGDEKPPIVLLHGLTDSGLTWNYLALALEPTYDVIMVDARGHGLSDKPESGYSREEHAADVAGLIETLGLQAPAVIGHSMGAATAALLAAKHPEMVKCLVLEDPPFGDDLWGENNTDREERAENWRLRIQALKDKSLNDLIEIGRTKHPSWDRSELFLWAKAKQLVSPDASKVILESQGSWRETVSRIECPTLLATGDTDEGAVIPQKVAEEAMQLLPDGYHAHISNAGHNIRRDQYRTFWSEVRGFLRKHARK